MGETVADRLRRLAAQKGWPDPNIIPSPAFLVVGSHPSEDRHGRTFYDNPSYYLTNESNPPGVDLSTGDKSRFIPVTFDTVHILALPRVYPNKFDVVIFDWSVVKFIKDQTTIPEYYMKLVKPGGQMILAETSNRNGANEQGRTDFLATLGALKYPMYVKPISEIVTESKVASDVYKPLIDGKYMDPANEGILIQKPAAGGRRKSRRRRRSTKRTGV